VHCVLKYDLFWRKFYGLLRRICIVQQMNEISYRYLLNSFDLLSQLILKFLYWLFFVWMTYLLARVEYTIIVLKSIYAFKSCSGFLFIHSFIYLNFYCFIIHMCIQCLGHFALMPPPPPLPPTLPPPSPLHPLNTQQKLFCPYF
jgi:hypothetical protein